MDQRSRFSKPASNGVTVKPAPQDTGELAIRLPPQNLAAERGVLGSVLRDNDTLDDVVQILRVESFYAAPHQAIFSAFLQLRNDRHSVIDLVTLREFLKGKGQLVDVGDVPYLVKLWESVPTAGSWRYYAGIVREKYVARMLVHAGTEILDEAYRQEKSGNEMLTAAEQRIFRIAEMGESGSSVPLVTTMEEACAKLDKMRAGQGFAGLPTGFMDLDRRLSGLHPELILLAARPSCGKTSLGLQIARNVAVDQGKSVFFASLEMSRVELGYRLLSAESRVNLHSVRSGLFGREEAAKISTASSRLMDASIFIDHSPNQDVLRIAANARRHRLRDKIELMVIDYLQLITPENRKDSENVQLTVISRRLKNLQRELGIPILCLAQLNRQVENRTQGRPRLADIRGSGSLEQDADVVLMLWNPNEAAQKASGNPEPCIKVELLVEKQRNGPTGPMDLIFDRRYTRFENAAPEGYSDGR